MSEALFRVERRAKGVVWLTLDRPEIHNAFDDRLIAALTKELENLGADARVRVVVLTGAGRSFSAGADLNWMRRTATYGEADNLADASALAKLMQTLNELPKPTVARVNGAALGGGTGLVACCDIVVASAEATFGTTEVRLGLIPSVIGPYVLAAIGPRHARRLMLTGERISAAEAARVGRARSGAARPARCARSSASWASCCKRAGRDRGSQAPDPRSRRAPIDPPLIDGTAQRIAALRPRPEAREGIGAFLDKRAPAWLS